MKLIMMHSLPASGKSTRAKEIIEGGGDFVRVNRDLLRTMLHCDNWNHRNEEFTIEMEKIVVGGALLHDKNVVVDDTNLGDNHVDMWKAVADEFNATFEVEDMMETMTLADCFRHNRSRETKYTTAPCVPESVIRNMAMQYNYFDMKKIVVVDIDGTVADCSHRQHFVQNVQKDWKSFFAGMSDDTPRKDVYEAASDEAVAENAELVFVSARPEDYREQTEAWLQEHGMDYTALLMRRKGDKRPDTDVKKGIYNRYLKQYEIVKVYDDRPSVIRMWRELGLEVEDVGKGEEF